MEFNDTQVQNWNFTQQLESRCFGSKRALETQGTSAYMLFYERVVKKPLRIRVNRTEHDRLFRTIQFEKKD